MKEFCYSLRKIRDYWRECPISEEKEMITRILIVVGLVLSSSLCLAEDLPEDTDQIKSLTAEQAAKLVANTSGPLLILDNLNSINSTVANSLGKFRGSWLRLKSLTSIDKDTAQERIGKLEEQHSDRSKQ